MTTTALSGVRVVELSEVWAGPFGGCLLGDLGADVIKVESYPRTPPTRPVQVPDWRVSPGEGPPYERSWAQHQANRNKRTVALNIRSPRGAQVMRRLVSTVDVIIDTFSAGTMERLGFGWETLHELNPRLTAISLPGWGVEGPYRGYVSFGVGFDCVTGHSFVRGHPWRREDDTPGSTHSDATVPLSIVFAAVAALRLRERTGEGSFIDLSQVEQLASQLPWVYAEWALNRREPPRIGDGDPHIAPHGCYQTAGEDAWVVIIAQDDQQWAGLAAAAGHAEWAEDGHPWASVAGRIRERDAVESTIAAFARSAPRDELVESVQTQGAIAAPVADPQDQLLSPQLAAREWLQTVDHAFTGPRMQPGFLWRLEPDGPSWDRPCGLVGEHNREVLGEIGFDAEEIARLTAEGVIGTSYGDFPPRAE